MDLNTVSLKLIYGFAKGIYLVGAYAIKLPIFIAVMVALGILGVAVYYIVFGTLEFVYFINYKIWRKGNYYQIMTFEAIDKMDIERLQENFIKDLGPILYPSYSNNTHTRATEDCKDGLKKFYKHLFNNRSKMVYDGVTKFRIALLFLNIRGTRPLLYRLFGF